MIFVILPLHTTTGDLYMDLYYYMKQICVYVEFQLYFNGFKKIFPLFAGRKSLSIFTGSKVIGKLTEVVSWQVMACFFVIL